MTRALIVMLVLVSSAAAAEPLPYPKGTAPCAGDYVQSGNFCAPKSERARAAIPKTGQCPSGWSSSGGACQQMRR
jgi:hypothetical protein